MNFMTRVSIEDTQTRLEVSIRRQAGDLDTYLRSVDLRRLKSSVSFYDVLRRVGNTGVTRSKGSSRGYPAEVGHQIHDHVLSR